MAYPEQVARSFSLLVSGLSLSLTKSLQFIVFAVVVMGVTDVFCGCVECNVTYDEDSNACAVKCKPQTRSAAVKVNNSLLEYVCLDSPIWDKSACLWKEGELSVGAKVKSDSGSFHFKYDPAMVSCDNEWCELNIEFADGMCSFVEVSGSTCGMSENAPGFAPSVTLRATSSATSSATPSATPSTTPSVPPSNPLAIALGVSLPCLVIFVIFLMVVGCCVIKTQTRVFSRCFSKQKNKKLSRSKENGGDQKLDGRGQDEEHDGVPRQKSIRTKKTQ